MRMILAAMGTVVALSLLTMIVIRAVAVDLSRRTWPGFSLKGCYAGLVHFLFGRLPVGCVLKKIESQGYDVTQHCVRTADGYLLTMHRVVTRAGRPPASKGPVLLQHGLLQSSFAYAINDAGKALAFYLADCGYDVWLGNNRGNLHSRAHVHLQPTDPAFWSWSIDDLAKDVEAQVAHVCAATGHSGLVFVGHSQGCAQALEAFSVNETLCSRIRLFVALSPAAFISGFEDNVWMRSLAVFQRRFPSWFFVLCGEGAFIKQMELARHFFPAHIWGYLGECMFEELFEWSTALWEPTNKNLFYLETPSCVSSRNIAQWMQHALSGQFRWYDHGPVENARRYGTPEPPAYDLTRVSCKTAVFHGGQDKMVNAPRLLAALPNVCLAREVPHYGHLDVLNAADAHELVYPEIVRLMEQHSSA